MLVLARITDTLLVELAGIPVTESPTYYASYRTVSAATYAPDRSVGVTTGGVPVELVPPPDVGYQQVVDTISVRNPDSLPATVSITFESAATSVELITCTLGTGESLHYENGQGFYALDAGGKRK